MPVVTSDNGPLPEPRNNTPWTDHLYSGMNTVYVNASPPFWGEETSLMSGQFSGSVVPVAPVARGYLDTSDFDRDYKPAGAYRTEIPDEAERYLPPMASEVGKHVVSERDYF